MRKAGWAALVILLPIFKVAGQIPVQEIRGNVYDEITNQPLQGAEVFLKDTEPLLGAVTDENGNFIIEDVPVGRYVFTVSYVGYRTYSEDFLLNAGSKPFLKVGLFPAPEELDEVVITNKPYSIIAGTTNKKVTIEQAMRIAANYQDPARVMTSFPGVIVQNDQNNNLVVNGKSPAGLLWRIEGLDIVNPNHLSNAGTFTDQPTQSGGGVNILSSQMLGETNFILLPFSADYGNAYSGIMDMRFREGNKYENEYTAQASLIGLDFAAEGPIKKGNSSFLANYRYSTVGLLTQLGVDFGGEEITFQDLSFKLNFDHQNGGSLSVFAFGGISENNFYGLEDPEEYQIDKDSTQVFYGSEIYAVGFNDVRPISERLSFSFGGVWSSSANKRTANSLSRSGNIALAEIYDEENQLFSGKAELNYKINAASNLQGGVMINYYGNEVFAEDILIRKRILSSGKEEGVLYQPFIQYYTHIADQWSIEGGIRYMHYSFNGSSAFLPNVQLNYFLSEKTRLYANSGWSAKKQQPVIYLADPENKDLKMTQIWHSALGVHQVFENSLLSAELFFENFNDIPVHDHLESSYSVFNELIEIPPFALASEGTATVYGINASLERPFYNGFYYILGGAFYKSTYEGSDGIERSSQYNGSYSFSTTAGKEILRKKSDDVATYINLDTKFLYSGGLRTTPVNNDLTQIFGRTIFDDTRLFSEQLEDYIRLDFRISWRKEKPNYTRVVAIDIQNVLSTENEVYQYYDFRQDKVRVMKQLGIIPIIVYRIEF